MRNVTAVCAAVALVTSGVSAQAEKTVNGPMAFDPIDGSACDLTDNWSEAPFKVPAGFHQCKVSDERDHDIYPGADDLDDMYSINETRKQAGRFLYRNHGVDNGGAVSIVDLRTGDASVFPGRPQADGQLTGKYQPDSRLVGMNSGSSPISRNFR